jgi:hypothetical protein
MRTCQGESCCVVIKSRGLPRRRGVALATIVAEVPGHVIRQLSSYKPVLMTTKAICRPASVNIICMASRALDPHVRPGQRELGQTVMIVSDA